MSSVPKKADKLNLSLSLGAKQVSSSNSNFILNRMQTMKDRIYE